MVRPYIPGLAALFLLALCPTLRGEDVALKWTVEGPGVLLTWTVGTERASSIRGFHLSMRDQDGRTLVMAPLPASAREHYVPLWLGEGQWAQASLSIRKEKGYGATPPVRIEGPFREVDHRVGAEVSQIGETSCRLRILHKGSPCEVRVHHRRTLLITVPPHTSELTLDHLSPGTRYGLTLIPCIKKDGNSLRGERTELPPFSTKLGNAWKPVNKGRGLHGDEPMETGYGWRAQCFEDKNGNLLYTVPSKDLGLGLGRYNKKKRCWELRTLAGWTEERAVPVRPIFDGLFRVRRLQSFTDPQGGLHAVANVSTSSGKMPLDIHGSLHHFRWTGDVWDQYAGGTSFSRSVSRPLFNTWTGSGAGWGVSVNSKGVGLAVHVQKSLSSPGRLIAVRLDFRDPKQRWSVWQDGWKPHSYTYTFLPDKSPPRTLEDMYPSVVCVDDKVQWMVVFERKGDSRHKQPFWTALLYNDKTRTWLRWTDKQWQAEGELAPLPLGPLHGRSLTVLSPRKGRVEFFWRTGTDLWHADIRPSLRRWPKPQKIAKIHLSNRYHPCFAAKVSPSGKTTLVYSEDRHSLSVHGKGKVYHSENEVVLGDVGFFGRNRVILFSEGLKLKAVSERPLGGEKTAPAGAVPVPKEKSPDATVLTYLGSFRNTASDPVLPKGATRPVTPFYRAHEAGHMACTPEGHVFAPMFAFCHLCIFPPHHPKKPAVFWGGFWDYFMFPMGVAVDPVRKKVYIAHRVTNGGCGGILGGVVEIWNLSEAERCHWSKPGLRGKSRPREIKPGRIRDTFLWPSGMAVDAKGGFLYVANSLRHDVRKFDLSGETPKRVGLLGEGDLDFPRGVACTADGSVVVVDSRHHCLRIYDRAGSLHKTVGGPGRSPGRFLYPWGVAVDPRSGLIFVSDPQNRRIQIFDKEGALVSWFNRFTPANLDGTPLSKQPPLKIPGARVSSGPPGSLGESFGLACDGRGFLYAGTGSYIAKFRIERE